MIIMRPEMQKMLRRLDLRTRGQNARPGLIIMTTGDAEDANHVHASLAFQTG